MITTIVYVGIGVPCLHKEQYLMEHAVNLTCRFASLTQYTGTFIRNGLNPAASVTQAYWRVTQEAVSVIRYGAPGIVIDLPLTRRKDRVSICQLLKSIRACRVVGLYFTSWCPELSLASLHYKDRITIEKRTSDHQRLIRTPPFASDGFDDLRTINLTH
jgi:hypothetical protein